VNAMLAQQIPRVIIVGSGGDGGCPPAQLIRRKSRVEADSSLE